MLFRCQVWFHKTTKEFIVSENSGNKAASDDDDEACMLSKYLLSVSSNHFQVLLFLFIFALAADGC